MIKFTTTEMRLITGIPAKNLGVYKMRGNLYKDVDGLWPYENELNKAFIEQRGIPGKIASVLDARKIVKPGPIKKVVKKKAVRKVKPKANPKPKIKAKSKPVKKEVKKIVKPRVQKKEKEIESNKVQPLSELSKVTLEQKSLAIEKAKAENEIKRIELEKLKGSLIDFQGTMNTVKEYTETFKKELLQNIQTHIQDICARHSIESGKAGEYKQRVIDIINKSNKTSVEQLENKLK